MTDQSAQTPPSRDIVSRLRTFVAALTPRQRLIGAALIVAVLLLLFAGGSLGGRHVTLNGFRLAGQELAYLDAMAGARVPNGDYWLDPQSMTFGEVGNAQPLSAMGYEQYSGSPGDYYDGQLQTPQVQAPPQWGDVGQNYRGPFGDYMSDGQCSFVNGVPVGNC